MEEPSLRRRTVLAFIKAYNDWSEEDIIALRDPSCVHEIHPRSLNRPLMDNAKYRAFFRSMKIVFRNFHITVNDIFEDEKEGRIVVWARSTAETDMGPYRDEYMTAFWFNGRGDRITRIVEFVDSANSRRFFSRL